MWIYYNVQESASIKLKKKKKERKKGKKKRKRKKIVPDQLNRQGRLCSRLSKWGKEIKLKTPLKQNVRAFLSTRVINKKVLEDVRGGWSMRLSHNVS